MAAPQGFLLVATSELERMQANIIQALTGHKPPAPDDKYPSLWTVQQAAEKIAYEPKTIVGWIKRGRKNPNGTMDYLFAHSFSPNEYRIAPEDLYAFAIKHGDLKRRPQPLTR